MGSAVGSTAPAPVWETSMWDATNTTDMLDLGEGGTGDRRNSRTATAADTLGRRYPPNTIRLKLCQTWGWGGWGWQWEHFKHPSFLLSLFLGVCMCDGGCSAISLPTN